MAGQVHYQPVVLPVLVAAKDVPPLAAVARDRKAPEPARLGAIEGLGVMADEAAEKVLVEVGTAADDDKDVRKAAWRAVMPPTPNPLRKERTMSNKKNTCICTVIPPHILRHVAAGFVSANGRIGIVGSSMRRMLRLEAISKLALSNPV